MKRTLLVAGLSIALLFVGSVAFVAALTSPTSGPGTPEPYGSPPPIAAAPSPPGAPVAAPHLRPGDGRRGATALATSGEPAEVRSPVPMVDRVTQKAVRKALRAPSVEARLASCTRVWEFGGTPSAAGGPPRAAPAFLVLELEARGSELRVVDAKVRRWGGASEATVSCARDVLRSQVIPASKTRRPGSELVRMHFTLNPRGAVVAAR